MFAKYAKAVAAAVGTVVATLGVMMSGGSVEEIPGAATVIGGAVGTLFVLFGPKNAE